MHLCIVYVVHVVLCSCVQADVGCLKSQMENVCLFLQRLKFKSSRGFFPSYSSLFVRAKKLKDFYKSWVLSLNYDVTRFSFVVYSTYLRTSLFTFPLLPTFLTFSSFLQVTLHVDVNVSLTWVHRKKVSLIPSCLIWQQVGSPWVKVGKYVK